LTMSRVPVSTVFLHFGEKCKIFIFIKIKKFPINYNNAKNLLRIGYFNIF
jgi:hypothetical protein